MLSFSLFLIQVIHVKLTFNVLPISIFKASKAKARLLVITSVLAFVLAFQLFFQFVTPFCVLLPHIRYDWIKLDQP